MLDVSKDKEERKLKKVKIALMRNPKFALWSGVMMVGKTQVSDDIPSACTNGRDEIYGREFIRDLTEKELAFVILHENLHKAFRHLFIWRKLWEENPRLANMACDYVINLMLVKSDHQENHIAMPRKGGKIYGLYDERFANMNAKQVFDLLKQEQEQNGGDGTGGESFDDHDWEGAQELTEEEIKELERDVDQALRQGTIAHQKAHGKGKGGFDLAIDELLKPKVDWREMLREFVKSTCAAKDMSSWRRVNRRFLSGDVYMPSLIGERVERVVIGVDTSGSISGAELTRFITEVKALADEVHPSTVDLIYWGSSVVKHEEYTYADLPNIVSSTKPVSGGGTDPKCLDDYLQDKDIKPECIIVLTDGYVPNWGRNWNAPILWAVCNGQSSVFADCGKTIHIED